MKEIVIRLITTPADDAANCAASAENAHRCSVESRFAGKQVFFRSSEFHH